MRSIALQTNLDRIRELTEYVTPLASIVTRTNDTTSIHLEQGRVDVAKDEDPLFTRLLCKFTAGTVYPKHEHGENEYIIVMDGYIDIDVGNGYERLGQYDFMHIRPNILHSVYVEQETTALIICVPPSKDY